MSEKGSMRTMVRNTKGPEEMLKRRDAVF